MSNTKITLIALPDSLCKMETIDLCKLMKRAVRIEERMVKNVNIEDEQRRYNILCDRIEFFGHELSNDNDVLSCQLGANYLDFIADINKQFVEASKKARLTANFCPNTILKQQLASLESLAKKAQIADREVVKKKLDFYKKALDQNLNVIELQEHFVLSNPDDNKTDVDSKKLQEEFLSLKISDEMSQDTGGGHFKELSNQISKAIGLTQQKIPSSINFSELRHDVIAEIVHDYVYKRGQKIYVPVIYTDASEARPFPFTCLGPWLFEDLKELNQEPEIKIGMMTGRHTELDTVIKTYWFRNQEISIGRTHAETDEVAYKKSREMFLKMRQEERKYNISFYQTGFQPAVVGFYRALTEELYERKDKRPSLQVTPYYFMGGNYVKGKPWN